MEELFLYMENYLLEKFFTCHNQVCTDTRNIIKNSLFIALKGDNFNGNKFALEALEKGARWAVIDERTYHIEGKTILVDDSLKALQNLAHVYRKHLNIPVIGITGSNGKTTSKELIGRVLQTKMKVHVTPGNFNNHIGLPLTILGAPLDTELLLLEMGDNHPGEIWELSKISHPNYGLITNVGKDHIEGFGSFEKNKLAKKELYDYLEENQGQAFVPLFEEEVTHMVSDKLKCLYLGGKLKQLESNPFVRYTEDNGEIHQTQFIGDYNFKNIEMAHAIGLHFGVPARDIHEEITHYKPQSNRSQFVETKNNKVFLDAYNANPSSVQLAVGSFSKQELSPKKLCILGDMLELGSVSAEEHQNIIDQVDSLGLSAFYVGLEYKKIKSENKGTFFKDRFELIDHLSSNKLKDYQILIKGSRGIKLEDVLPHL